MNFSFTEKKKWRGRIIRYAPLILWTGTVFLASSTTGSMSNTSLIIRPLLEWLFPNTPADVLTIYHGYIRKFAHFFEYSVLAFFAARAFSNSSIVFLRKYWTIFAFLMVAAIASTDEYNQSFNTARTGSVYDVLLDCAGGLTMILLISLYKNKTSKK
ncbi:MAG TPA: VanZ family protein [Pyrinomonadaceae bacterium]|nr:VanZ family protein [Pyrinomonadaceae bacterium]